MIRSDSEQLAQVQGEHMLLIMHCWHYHRIPWYMMIHKLLDPHNCFDSDDSFNDGHIQAVVIDATDNVGLCYILSMTSPRS